MPISHFEQMTGKNGLALEEAKVGSVHPRAAISLTTDTTHGKHQWLCPCLEPGMNSKNTQWNIWAEGRHHKSKCWQPELRYVE